MQLKLTKRTRNKMRNDFNNALARGEHFDTRTWLKSNNRCDECGLKNRGFAKFDTSECACVP